MNSTLAKENILGLLHAKLIQLLPFPQRKEFPQHGIALTRYDSMTSPENCLCSPMIALVVNGRKRSFYGDFEVNYGKGEFVILCSDMPGVFHITKATPTDPFLSVSIRLDPKVIRALLADNHCHMEGLEGGETIVSANEASQNVLLTFYRLLQLSGSQAPDEFLLSMVVKELHYFALNSNLGEKLCLFSMPGTRDNRIARAVDILRRKFREQINMEDLAKEVNMAPSTFNKYFKELTCLSPLQFQKHLRLHEAQRLLLMENMDARAAASAVGYESESQFSREYKRHFGQPPIRNTASTHSHSS